jgi:chromate transporter
MITESLSLFFSFLKVGAFSFGGAYSLIPVIEKEVVQSHSWLAQDEFLRVLSMVEIFPGAISIKFATYTGYKIAGIPGVVAANLGNMAVPIALILAASYLFAFVEANPRLMKAVEGMKFAILGMILAILYQYTLKNYPGAGSIIFLVLGFSLTLFFRLHPALIAVISGVLAYFLPMLI